MRIIVENKNVECFETEQDYKHWLTDNGKDQLLFENTLYHGAIYEIPQNIRNMFKENILVSVRTMCYTDTQFLVILK